MSRTARHLGSLTSAEAAAAAERGAVVLIPIGAFEQHGPHLPLDVDIHLSQTIAERVSQRAADAYVAPAIPWGQSGAHMPFAGTITLSPTTMLTLLLEITGSLAQHGFRRLAFVNYHMSNRALVTVAARQVAQEHGVSPLHVFCSDFAAELFAQERTSARGGELHAGEFETSIELHLRPELVHLDRAVRNPVDPERHFGSRHASADMFSGGLVQTGVDLCACAPDGVLGDPTVADAALGERLVAAMVERITEVVDEFGACDASAGP